MISEKFVTRELKIVVLIFRSFAKYLQNLYARSYI